MLGFNVQIFKALQKNITTSNMDVCYLLTWYVRVAWRIVRSLLTDFVLYWDSIFINLFNFWFLRNCKKIWQYQTLNIRNIELFTKVVTYQTTPLNFASKTLILDVWQDLNEPYKLMSNSQLSMFFTNTVSFWLEKADASSKESSDTNWLLYIYNLFNTP